MNFISKKNSQAQPKTQETMEIFPEKAKFTIGDITFDDYYSTIKKHFDGGTKTIELCGIGKHIPTVIGLA